MNKEFSNIKTNIDLFFVDVLLYIRTSIVYSDDFICVVLETTSMGIWITYILEIAIAQKYVFFRLAIFNFGFFLYIIRKNSTYFHKRSQNQKFKLSLALQVLSSLDLQVLHHMICNCCHHFIYN